MHKILFKIIEQLFSCVIVTPTIETFGNCAEEIQYSLIKGANSQRKVVLIFPLDILYGCRFSKDSLGVNESLLKVDSKYLLQLNSLLTFQLRLLVTIEYSIYRAFNKFLSKKRIATNPKFRIQEIYNINKEESYNKEILLTKCWDRIFDHDIDVHLKAIDSKRALEGRRKLGVPDNAWFVCVHVRDSGYYGNDEGPQKKARNASILQYLKAFETITNCGGWVIRLGDASMEKIPNLNQVVDYAHSKYKSDLLDVYLIQECAFFIGTPSGPLTVANLFQKQILLTNMYEHYIDYPMREGDLGIMKKFYLKSESRFLTLKEQIAKQIKSKELLYKSKDIELIENDEVEIDCLVSEFMDGKSSKVTKSQLDWDRMRVESGFQYYDKLYRANLISLTQVYRFSSRLLSYKGRIANYLIEEVGE